MTTTVKVYENPEKDGSFFVVIEQQSLGEATPRKEYFTLKEGEIESFTPAQEKSSSSLFSFGSKKTNSSPEAKWGEPSFDSSNDYFLTSATTHFLLEDETSGKFVPEKIREYLLSHQKELANATNQKVIETALRGNRGIEINIYKHGNDVLFDVKETGRKSKNNARKQFIISSKQPGDKNAYHVEETPVKSIPKALQNKEHWIDERNVQGSFENLTTPEGINDYLKVNNLKDFAKNIAQHVSLSAKTPTSSSSATSKATTITTSTAIEKPAVSTSPLKPNPQQDEVERLFAWFNFLRDKLPQAPYYDNAALRGSTAQIYKDLSKLVRDHRKTDAKGIETLRSRLYQLCERANKSLEEAGEEIYSEALISNVFPPSVKAATSTPLTPSAASTAPKTPEVKTPASVTATTSAATSKPASSTAASSRPTPAASTSTLQAQQNEVKKLVKLLQQISNELGPYNVYKIQAKQKIKELTKLNKEGALAKLDATEHEKLIIELKDLCIKVNNQLPSSIQRQETIFEMGSGNPPTVVPVQAAAPATPSAAPATTIRPEPNPQLEVQRNEVKRLNKWLKENVRLLASQTADQIKLRQEISNSQLSNLDSLDAQGIETLRVKLRKLCHDVNNELGSLHKVADLSFFDNPVSPTPVTSSVATPVPPRVTPAAATNNDALLEGLSDTSPSVKASDVSATPAPAVTPTTPKVKPPGGVPLTGMVPDTSTKAPSSAPTSSTTIPMPAVSTTIPKPQQVLDEEIVIKILKEYLKFEDTYEELCNAKIYLDDELADLYLNIVQDAKKLGQYLENKNYTQSVDIKRFSAGLRDLTDWATEEQHKLELSSQTQPQPLSVPATSTSSSAASTSPSSASTATPAAEPKKKFRMELYTHKDGVFLQVEELGVENPSKKQFIISKKQDGDLDAGPYRIEEQAHIANIPSSMKQIWTKDINGSIQKVNPNTINNNIRNRQINGLATAIDGEINDTPTSTMTRPAPGAPPAPAASSASTSANPPFAPAPAPAPQPQQDPAWQLTLINLQQHLHKVEENLGDLSNYPVQQQTLQSFKNMVQFLNGLQHEPDDFDSDAFKSDIDQFLAITQQAQQVEQNLQQLQQQNQQQQQQPPVNANNPFAPAPVQQQPRQLFPDNRYNENPQGDSLFANSQQQPQPQAQPQPQQPGVNYMQQPNLAEPERVNAWLVYYKQQISIVFHSLNAALKTPAMEIELRNVEEQMRILNQELGSLDALRSQGNILNQGVIDNLVQRMDQLSARAARDLADLQQVAAAQAQVPPGGPAFNPFVPGPNPGGPAPAPATINVRFSVHKHQNEIIVIATDIFSFASPNYFKVIFKEDNNGRAIAEITDMPGPAPVGLGAPVEVNMLNIKPPIDRALIGDLVSHGDVCQNIDALEVKDYNINLSHVIPLGGAANPYYISEVSNPFDPNDRKLYKRMQGANDWVEVNNPDSILRDLNNNIILKNPNTLNQAKNPQELFESKKSALNAGLFRLGFISHPGFIMKLFRRDAGTPQEKFYVLVVDKQNSSEGLREVQITANKLGVALGATIPAANPIYGTIISGPAMYNEPNLEFNATPAEHNKNIKTKLEEYLRTPEAGVLNALPQYKIALFRMPANAGVTHANDNIILELVQSYPLPAPGQSAKSAQYRGTYNQATNQITWTKIAGTPADPLVDVKTGQKLWETPFGQEIKGKSRKDAFEKCEKQFAEQFKNLRLFVPQAPAIPANLYNTRFYMVEKTGLFGRKQEPYFVVDVIHGADIKQYKVDKQTGRLVLQDPREDMNPLIGNGARLLSNMDSYTTSGHEAVFTPQLCQNLTKALKDASGPDVAISPPGNAYNVLLWRVPKRGGTPEEFVYIAEVVNPYKTGDNKQYLYDGRGNFVGPLVAGSAYTLNHALPGYELLGASPNPEKANSHETVMQTPSVRDYLVRSINAAPRWNPAASAQNLPQAPLPPALVPASHGFTAADRGFYRCYANGGVAFAKKKADGTPPVDSDYAWVGMWKRTADGSLSLDTTQGVPPGLVSAADKQKAFVTSETQFGQSSIPDSEKPLNSAKITELVNARNAQPVYAPAPAASVGSATVVRYTSPTLEAKLNQGLPTKQWTAQESIDPKKAGVIEVKYDPDAGMSPVRELEYNNNYGTLEIPRGKPSGMEQGIALAEAAAKLHAGDKTQGLNFCHPDDSVAAAIKSTLESKGFTNVTRVADYNAVKAAQAAPASSSFAPAPGTGPNIPLTVRPGRSI